MVGLLLLPWRRTSTWWSLTHSVLNPVIGFAWFGFFATCAMAAVGLLVIFPVLILLVWLVFVMTRVGATLERSRISALLGEQLPDPVPPLSDRNWFWRLAERFTCKARWSELAYLLLLLPFGLLTAAIVVTAWVAGSLMLAFPLYADLLPAGSSLWGLALLSTGVGKALAALVGLVIVVLIAPWVTVAMGAFSLKVGRWLLTADREVELEQTVEALEISRSAAVDSAESERRRIERDLHDGAQQRLVALAIDLGMARSRPDLTLEESRDVIARSHDELKAAMKDLRDLVRGVHPVILEDRGLDAALSAVVARSPIPVNLTVSVDQRMPDAVESAAYFVVSECLTNVARHSRATSVTVTVANRSQRLLIDVTDNGCGGADSSQGTGLHGLSVRVSSLAGWMRIVSPVGGPTSVIVELPCEGGRTSEVT